jgi:hypothetical protein
MFGDKIEEMGDGKQKELLKILNDGAKPFMRKHDGYAVKVDEDTEIKWKEGEQETSIKIPAGDYIKVDGDSCYPEIETAESFEKKNKIVGGEEKSKAEPKKDDKPKIGMAVIADENTDY